MTIIMQQNDTPTIEELRQFALGSASTSFKATNKLEAYSWLQGLLVKVKYVTLTKPDKGIVRVYAQSVTGYSRAQVARLISQYVGTGSIRLEPPNVRNQFARRYTAEDIALLAVIDNAHDRLSGKATRELARRAYETFSDERYVRLANISTGHIYNLRDTPTYQRTGRTFTKTQSTTIPIGERRKPHPNGAPGFVRVDTVHQGDQDGDKGVYHINLVDEVTQWEVVVAVERITERYMIPALEAAFESFPFELINFHADNGSEYINRKVAALLKTMLVKMTKGRAYHSGDNALAETKNGSIVRKWLGYSHIPREHAPAINIWYKKWFVPYLNFHRPCGYRVTTVDAKSGKRTHKYPSNGYMTPYAKLKSLPNSKTYLKPNSSFENLDVLAYSMNDTDWAVAMAKAKEQLMKSIAAKDKLKN
jgi:transposase InsO family protein